MKCCTLCAAFHLDFQCLSKYPFGGFMSTKGYLIRAVTGDFQQCGILTSVDSDEPVQPPFKLRNTK